jgi:hypothetical protein
MHKLFLSILVLGTVLVPSIVLSNNGTSTNKGTGTRLELVPRQVPMVPMVPKGPLDASKLVKGAHYISLDCNLSKDILHQIKYRYGMTPVWWGMNEHDHTYFIHRNPKNDNWIMLAAFKSGSICSVGTGPTGALVDEKAGMLH